MRSAGMVIAFLIIATSLIPVVNAEEVKKVTVDLENAYGEGDYNLAEYKFRNPFISAGLNGIYYGPYLPPSVYQPDVNFNDECIYNLTINLTSDIIASGASDFYILSPFYSATDEHVEIGGMRIDPSRNTDNRSLYHVRGVFPPGIYTFSFVTADNNFILYTTQESIGNWTVCFDTVEYGIAYRPDVRFLFTKGSGAGFAFLPVYLPPGHHVAMSLPEPEFLTYDTYSVYVPVLSSHLYKYTINMDNDFVPTQRVGYNNHHVVINSTMWWINDYFSNRVWLRITNDNGHPITVTFMIRESASYVTLYYNETKENIKASPIYYEKELPTNSVYEELWKMYDISEYDERNKTEFKEFFGWVHSIIDIRGERYELNTTSDNLRNNIKQVVSAIAEKGESITGSISLMISSVYKQLLEIGKFIKTSFIMLKDFILSLFKEIINVFELLLENVIIPAISFYSVLFSINIMLNGVYEIKRIRRGLRV